MTAKKKAPTKKAAKKTTPKKAAAKKTASKKNTAAKKTSSKAAKKTSSSRNGSRKASGQEVNAPAPSETPKTAESQESASNDIPEEALRILNKRPKHTPAVFKKSKHKVTPIVFTLEDVREVIKKKGSDSEDELKRRIKTAGRTKEPPPPRQEEAETPAETPEEPPVENRKLGAASLADILGFQPQPAQSTSRKSRAGDPVPRKWAKYHELLIELRDHVKEGLDLHARETLKRSNKDDTGDLSSYSQHMADAGTDTFDRDFALSLVSNEQEALYEIEEAIDRIHKGTYGTCEITGKPIKKERLLAVPFTRYSVEGQIEFEKNRRKSVERGGVFLDATGDNAISFTDEDSDD